MKKLSALFVLFSFFISFSQENNLELSQKNLEGLAKLPLHCIEVEYPNKLNQVLTDSSYIDSPENLHPVFYGCFDWHSSVHGYWLLASVMNRFPESALSAEITALFDKQFSPEKIEKELAYFEPKLEKSFERTYGWAWLLKLHEALSYSEKNESHGWTKSLQPLTDFIVESYKNFLPKLVYPIRVGEHTNTAFGISLSLDYAIGVNDTAFENLLKSSARKYYYNDCKCPFTWEPSGYDFLSPCLQEAELMSKVLEEAEFEKWMKSFLPELCKEKFIPDPGKVSDRTDGKLVHLDGLNFSRAQNLYACGKMSGDFHDFFFEIADNHIKTSINYVIGSDYMGSHWLATFLVYALIERNEGDQYSE